MQDTKYDEAVTNIYTLVQLKLESGANIEPLLNQIENLEKDFIQHYNKRKNEGMYFTQKHISEYIISQTLLEYFKPLDINISQLSDFETLTSTSIKEIIRIRFCDPACGSGIFLVGILNVMFDILGGLPDQENIITLKEKVIENISGYDINKTSIKLCILNLLKRVKNEYGINLKKAFLCFHENITDRDVIDNPPTKRFDIIVGNPPYGNILKKSSKMDLKGSKIYINDIYCVFLKMALDWSNGVIGFLTPKSFLLRQGYLKFRNHILEISNFLKIIDIGPNLFKSATNEVLVVIYETKNKRKKDLNVLSYPNTEIITYKNQIFDSLRLCLNNKCQLSEQRKKIYPYVKENNCKYCGNKTYPINRIRIKTTEEVFKLLEKIESEGNLNYINIREFPKFIRGEEHLGLKNVKRIIEPNLMNSCYFISAKDDFDYYFMKKTKTFNIESIDSAILKGTNYEYYKDKKLLIKHNNIIPQALYTEESVCFTSSIYSLLHKDEIELKYLCGIINSAVIQFYCLFGINNQINTTINLNQYMVRHLPIVDIDRELKEMVSDKVDFIRKYLKHNEKLDDTIYYVMKQLDKMVFDVYGLSAEEQALLISNLKNHVPFFNHIYEKDYNFIYEREWTKIKRAPNF